jgi:hypothetical protein
MASGFRSFDEYHQQAKKEAYAQFKGNDFKSGRTFLIAARDANVLRKALNCPIDDASVRGAVIVKRRSGFREIWVNPHLATYRSAHLAAFDALGIRLSVAVRKAHDSDHTFPASAAIAAEEADMQVGLVRMSLIPSGANRSFGASFEKRFTHRTLNEHGICAGTVFDLYKSVGGRFLTPRDPAGAARAMAEELILMGVAPDGDREKLLSEGKAAMDYIQNQDTAYAYRTGQA